MVLGQAGTGKTTLVRASIGNLARGNIRCVHLNNPTLTRDELIEWLAGEFELGGGAAHSKAALLARLEALLLERRDAGVITALIVDEAQALPDDLLGELRLLLNLESDSEKLLTIVLVGQAELADRLNLPEHAAVKQRIALRCELLPLTLAETAQYVAARIRVAGGVPAHVFSREAVDLIHERSRGIPRTISVICDNALVNGFAANARPVGPDIVLEVCRDFQIQPPTSDGAGTPVIDTALATVPVVNAPSQPPLPAPAPASIDAAKSEREAAALFSGYNKPRRFFLFSR